MKELILCDKRKGILNSDSHLLISGGPGSGKTTIALLKARVLVEELQPGQQVLFLSFSNAAIQQIEARAHGILPKEIRRFVAIQTYHSFCWSLLKAHGYLLGSAAPLTLVAPHDETIARHGVQSDLWPTEAERLFKDDGRITFDLFGPKVAALLSRSTSLRAIYARAHPTIIVDEFQDTDHAQWALVKEIGRLARVIALADQEQRIYAWRPGVSETRVAEYVEVFRPECFDFAGENNRSPGGNIVAFGNALLRPGIALPWSGDVARHDYPPTRDLFGISIKLAVLQILQRVRSQHGEAHPSIAVLCRGNRLAVTISEELDRVHAFRTRQLPNLVHELIVEQAPIVLAGRFVATLMEAPPLTSADLVSALELLGNVFIAAGTQGDIGIAIQFRAWVAGIHEGKAPKGKVIPELKRILEAVATLKHSGDPIADWKEVRRVLEATTVTQVARIAGFARQLRALRRGAAIEASLGACWLKHGSYRGARDAFDSAIAQEQMFDGLRPPSGIVVMTMHKAKGKEFDGVVIAEHHQWGSFVTRHDQPPYMEARRLMRVGVTRARYGVRFVLPRGNECQIFR